MSDPERTTYTLVPELLLPSFEFDTFHAFTVWIGGRAAGKSLGAGLWTTAYVEWWEATTGSPAFFVCARKTEKSVDYSSQKVVQNLIRNTGRLGIYHLFKTYTRTPLGGEIVYVGMSGQHGTAEAVKSMEGACGVWYEEGQYMDETTRELLYPTILRTPGARFLITANPRKRNDPMALDFIAPGRRKSEALVTRINFMDLPEEWREPAEEQERQLTLKYEPHRYATIWEGEFDDESGDRKVIPYALARLCVDAWEKRPVRGKITTAGLDVADTGTDMNSLCLRCGPEVFHMSRWPGDMQWTISDTTRHAAVIATNHGVTRFFYDMVGVGAGVRGPLREWMLETGLRMRDSGENNGGKVQSPSVNYILNPPKKQDQVFANWYAQAAWIVRIRAENTHALMNGEDVDPGLCLFIDPAIPDLEEHLTQIAQPEVDDATGKLRIVKQPRKPGEPKPPSPDAFDSLVYAMSYDARNGIERSRWRRPART